MKMLKRLALVTAILSIMLLFSCSSKGTVVSGGSSASTSNAANPVASDSQDQTDDGNDHDVRNEAPADTGAGH